MPCCLEIITCEEYDNVVKENHDKPTLGGAMGKHKVCPKNAEEAHRLASGSLFSLEIKHNISIYDKSSENAFVKKIIFDFAI